MKKQKLFSALNNSFTVLRSIIFLFAVVFGIVQTTSAQQVGKVTVEVGKTKCNKLRKPVIGNVQKTVDRTAIARALFNPTTEDFCVEGLTVGQARVTFTGTYRDENNNGGMIGGVQQNSVRFRYDLDVTVVPRVENIETNVTVLPTERGKNVRIFYTNLREYDAQKASRILRDRGYVPDKKLIEDGENTQSQKNKLYCVLSSGGTEAGVRGIGELIKNIEKVRTECLDDRPNTDPQYSLWIVSEQPFLTELEDYKKEIEEAKNDFNLRFGAPTGNNYIKRAYIAEFNKEGTGDWNGYSGSWSDGFWLRYVQPNSNTAAAITYDRPLAILQTSIYNVKEKSYSPTQEEISHFRRQMIDWRARKDALTPRLNEIIVLDAQHNSDIYANSRLKTLSNESQKNREIERRERRKIIDAEITELKGRPVFAYTLGGARNR